MKKLFMTMALVAAVFTMGSCEKENATDEKLKVTYAANNGTNETAVEQVDMGTEITFTATSWTYTGYIFKGWDTDQDATTPAYEIGDKLTINANTTIYAIWEQELTANNFIRIGEVEQNIISAQVSGTGMLEIILDCEESNGKKFYSNINIALDLADGELITKNTTMNDYFTLQVSDRNDDDNTCAGLVRSVDNLVFRKYDGSGYITVDGGEASVTVTKTASNLKVDIELKNPAYGKDYIVSYDGAYTTN